ncbi:MAG: Bug family tripartite tricarboxylate transporter substrate binding protein [Xanthobacteraceae bacterium]
MRRLVVAALLTALSGTTIAHAENFPSRPITIVVALPAGGGVDALARLLAEHMKTTLGQPVIVENMGGAGGTISIQRVVRSAPDGYTIGMGTLGQYVISGAVYTLAFDMLKDLAPVALLPSVPYWMVVRKDLPASNLKELVTWLKANKASAATTGTASLARFCGMAFQAATGTNYQFVPYRGGAPALKDLVGGQIDLSCDLAASSLAQARAGNIKALAVMTKTRWSAAPDVPTAEESGFPGMYFSTWQGLWAPKGTPADVVAKVNAAANAAMADPTTQQRMAAMGLDLPPSDQRTPAAFAEFHAAEVAKWYPIVKAAGVKAQ